MSAFFLVQTGNWRRMAVLPGDLLTTGAWRYGFLARKASGNGMMNHFFALNGQAAIVMLHLN